MVAIRAKEDTHISKIFLFLKDFITKFLIFSGTPADVLENICENEEETVCNNNANESRKSSMAFDNPISTIYNNDLVKPKNVT